MSCAQRLNLFSYSLWGFQYNFEGRYDLVRFIKTIQKAGLYAHLRIGPYVCAEWNFGYISSSFSSCLDLKTSGKFILVLILLSILQRVSSMAEVCTRH